MGETEREDLLTRGEHRWTKIGTDGNERTGDDTSVVPCSPSVDVDHIDSPYVSARTRQKASGMNWVENAPNKRPEILLHATKSQTKKFTLSSPSATTAVSDSRFALRPLDEWVGITVLERPRLERLATAPSISFRPAS
jgi:hypothetical protein